MTIQLEKLVPLPLAELPSERSSLWEADAFSFFPGKRYLVEAPSGKGKTSLLSVMYGLRKDYRGKLFVDGRNAADISGKEWSDLRKNRISYIFQGLELFGDLTAMDNILLKNRITGYKTHEEIIEMAEVLHVTGSLHKKCRILSFGQQQRVAIIRALCQPFQFLFADECFSHIDRRNGEAAMELITRECAGQKAGLVVTSLGNRQEGFHEKIVL